MFDPESINPMIDTINALENIECFNVHLIYKNSLDAYITFKELPTEPVKEMEKIIGITNKFLSKAKCHYSWCFTARLERFENASIKNVLLVLNQLKKYNSDYSFIDFRQQTKKDVGYIYIQLNNVRAFNPVYQNKLVSILNGELGDKAIWNMYPTANFHARDINQTIETL